jgi:hypothetical protein
MTNFLDFLTYMKNISNIYNGGRFASLFLSKINY